MLYDAGPLTGAISTLAASHRLGSSTLPSPVRPAEVIRCLKISQAILVGILATGDLPRPGKLTRGHVAWRKDEVESLVPLRER